MKQLARRTYVPWLLALSATAFFLAGLLTPAVRLEYHFFDSLVDVVVADLTGMPLNPEYSIVAGIVNLYSDGDVALATLLFSFTIAFPTAKLVVLFVALIARRRWTHGPTKFVSAVGYWSMLDVFVIAVLVSTFKSFPGGTQIVPLSGTYFFCVSVLLGMVATILTKKLISDHTVHPTTEDHENPQPHVACILH